jgi:hypothetical protein
VNRATEAVGAEPSTAPPPSSIIEVDSMVYKKLSEISDKEGIPISQLANELLKAMFLFNRKQVNEIITRLRQKNCRK